MRSERSKKQITSFVFASVLGGAFVYVLFIRSGHILAGVSLFAWFTLVSVISLVSEMRKQPDIADADEKANKTLWRAYVVPILIFFASISIIRYFELPNTIIDFLLMPFMVISLIYLTFYHYRRHRQEVHKKIENEKCAKIKRKGSDND